MFYLTRSRISAIVLSVIATLLAGCLNLQTNIALHGQDEWHGVMAMQFAPEFVEMMEQGDSQTSTDTAELEEMLAHAQSAADRSDLNVTFDEVKGEDGSLNYLLQAEGQTLQSLNEVFFEGKADISVTEVNGQRQITIRADMAEDSDQAPSTPEDIEMMKAFGLGVTVRISGGEIISSNASRVEGNTAIWDFPTTIEVTLTEAPAYSPEAIALVAPPAGSNASLALLQGMLTELEQNQASGQLPLELSEMVDPAPEPSQPAGPARTEPAEDLPAVETDLALNIVPPDQAQERQALPASGGIRPEQFSPGTLTLAALTLLALGFGAITQLRPNSSER
ncbi:MAG TPA: hypothetical protein PKE64_27115 [Anaerolineae bacterium]|nr:hypothetical protein [Anaerolineae bacterium]HMR67698.1 hypothetical protein [Anaerolineae bacterium]